MRKRIRTWIKMGLVLTVAVGAEAFSGPVVAMGKRVQSVVVVNTTTSNGVITQFSAAGALASARLDPGGAGKEEIGCWTIDGESVTCLAADRTGVPTVSCIVADQDVNGNSLGFVARLAAINGDSNIAFSGVADDPNDPFTGYTCTSLRVENRSIYYPKVQ